MEVKTILISEIKIRENIRQYPIDKNIPELMQSIKDNGLLQPIGVKEENSHFVLLWGFRRMEACKKLGWKTIPAVIFLTKEQDMTEEEFFIINATENMQRKENNLKEFGRVCKILKRNLSISEIAKRLSVPKSRVESALNEYGRIPIKWQDRIRIMNGEREKEGDIPLFTASKIMSFKGITKEQKDQLLENVSKNDEGYVRSCYLASLMRTGKSFKEAKSILNKYKLITFKTLVDKDKLKEILETEKFQNYTQFLIEILNKEYGSDFAVITEGLYTESGRKTK